MDRIFITAISLQGRGDLEKGLYQPDGFQLQNNRATSFPIIPVIVEHLSQIKNIKVIALRTENDDVKDNYQEFLGELRELGVKEEQVTPIPVEENQSKRIGFSTLMRIIDEISEDSVVYADITYGTKPMSAIILYAISFIEKLKDAEVEGVFYGELPRRGGKAMWERAKLYDLTTFKYLADLIEQLNALQVSNPRAALQKLIDM